MAGKRFTCTQCGKCCTGPGLLCSLFAKLLPAVDLTIYEAVDLTTWGGVVRQELGKEKEKNMVCSAGEVWVTELECLQISQHLGLSIHNFLPRYTKSYSNRKGWRMLRSRGKDAVSLGSVPLRPVLLCTWPPSRVMINLLCTLIAAPNRCASY